MDIEPYDRLNHHALLTSRHLDIENVDGGAMVLLNHWPVFRLAIRLVRTGSALLQCFLTYPWRLGTTSSTLVAFTDKLPGSSSGGSLETRRGACMVGLRR